MIWIKHLPLLTSLLFMAACSCAMAAELGVFKPLKPDTEEPIRLQDFCIFRHDGYTYVATMKKDLCGQGILIARSSDLKDWTVLGDAVSTRTPEDKSMVWAPHVVEESGVYHMFYTGVTTPKPGQWCQRILVASTKNPVNASEWQRNFQVKFIVDGNEQSWFRPSHPGAVWTDSAWADCRDPMVLKHKGTWYMFYSGSDTDGGIAGVATAPRALGPWTDHGAVMKLGPGSIPESCYVLVAPDGSFVMTFNHAGQNAGGSKSARAKSLIPVNGKPSFSDLRSLTDQPSPLTGWAHEFIPGRGDILLCANLTGYFVNLKDAWLRREEWGWTVGEEPAKAK